MYGLKCQLICYFTLVAYEAVLVQYLVTLMTSKSIGVIYWSNPTSTSSLKTIGEGIVKLSLGQGFRVETIIKHNVIFT